MKKFVEINDLSRQIKAACTRRKLPQILPGVVIAFTHWAIAPLLLIYSCLVSENVVIIGLAILVFVMTGAIQRVYSGKCPLIYLERELLDCPHWWHGLPFNIVANHIPMVIIWGTGVSLIRFITNVIN